jgi:cellobiose phosphorylase
MVDIINQCDDQHFNRVYFDKELNSLFATKTYWVTATMGTQQQENKEWDQWVYFTSNCPVKNYETLRERFIGNYRNENNPIALEQDSFSNKDTDYGNAVGAIQIEVELQPNETKDVVFTMGVIEKEKFNELKSGIVSRYNDTSLIDTAFEQLQNEWDNYFAFTSVQTPDEQANIFMNYWTPYQAKVAYDVGRVASFYYWGISRGFGFRDTAQDTIAVTISNPEKAKERIFLLARQMFTDGKVFHHFYKDGQGELTKHADDPLWFILAVTDYIKQTGDVAILDKVEPFVDNKEGTILDHLFAVVNFAKNNIGPHNLPIFGRGDWNDTLDYIGGEKGGESVWAAMFYAAMLNYLIELLYFVNKKDKIEEVEFVRNRLVNSLEEFCWDGEWYIRAFDGDNNKIGTHTNKYGKIFINTQSWPVLAQLPDRDRLIRSLDSVKKELDTEYGPKICAPAFREINPKIGLITRCVWGKKENGAVFCHPTTWLIQAETLMRRGNQAFDYYKRLLPNAIDEDIYKAEPYVYSQYITSNEHESAGRASHSWQTGTAAWMFRVCLDHIIGVRATYTGLLIDPVVPTAWKEFSCQRIFRGTKYIINIINPDCVEAGVRKITVDGIEIIGNIIPVSKKNKCKVEVVMGKK